MPAIAPVFSRQLLPLRFCSYPSILRQKVVLSDLRCTESPYSNSSFRAFGMGFATNSSATWEDTMYVENGSQLVSLDPMT